MTDSYQLALLRASNPGVVIPGIDTVTGFVDPGTELTGLSQLSRASQAPVHYNPATNTVSIIRDGVVLGRVDKLDPHPQSRELHEAHEAFGEFVIA